MWFALVAAVIIGALLIYTRYLTGRKGYWKKYGVPEIDTSPALGMFDVFLGRKNMTDADDYAYKQMGTTEKFCGIMQMGTPTIVVKDMELVKKVLIKDFDYFVDRRKLFGEDDRSLGKMLITLDGDEWKNVRASVSPTFTTGKIKKMMEYFNTVGKEWVGEFTRKAKSNPSGSVIIDVLSSVNQYTVDVISTTVFGMNASVIKNSDSPFMKMANRLAYIGPVQILKFAIRLNFPKVSKFLGYSVIDFEALAFFEKILEQGMKSRVSGETKRNDFLQLLAEAQKGELKADDELSSFEKDAIITTTGSEKKVYLTDEIVNAQSVLFFFAGFSTTSNFITFALYALSLHQEVQNKLRQEVSKIVKEDGSLDYDDVGHLVYMDMVVCEVLRRFSAASRLERLCVKEYRDPEIGLIIPKGTLVAVPLNAIHNDKKYYDNPDKFDPEHFSPEKKAARSPYAFMPFGMGPRNCIGMRFAQIEVKAAIAHMVHSFLIEPTAKTPVPLRGAPAGLQVVPPKKLELKLTPIRDTKK